MTVPIKARLSPAAWRFIGGEMRDRRWKLAAFLALGLVAGIIELVGVGLVYPLLIIALSPESLASHPFFARVFGTVGAGGSHRFFVIMAAIVAAIMVMKNVYMGFFNWLQQRTLARWKTRLSARLMRLYLFSDYRLFLEKTSSEMILNIALTGLVYDQFVAGMINLIVSGTILAALGVLLLVALPLKVFASLLCVCLAAALLYATTRKTFERIGRDLNDIFKARQSVLRQAIGLIKETKIMSKEGFFLDTFARIEARNFIRNAHYNFLSTLPPLMIESASIITIIALVSYILFVSGQEPFGVATLGLLVVALFRAAPLLNKILSALRLINISRNSVETVAREIEGFEHAVVGAPREEAERLPFTERVRLEKIAFAYPSSHTQALRNVSLDIRRHEFIGITGMSGAGKTTLTAVIMGLIQPTAGAVSVDGVKLDTPRLVRSWQKNLGYVAQHILLIEDSVAANIAFGETAEDIDRQRVWQVLETVQMKGFVEGLPGGIDYFLGEDGIRLSGGQRQRIGIARALYHDPSVLVLDEATAALDVATEQAFAASLEAMRGSRTLIVIAHRLSTLRHCDRIVMMAEGGVIGIDSFEGLEDSCPEFRRLVELSKLGRAA